MLYANGSLLSPILLDDQLHFDNNAYADIQRWLGGIIHASHDEPSLRSPIKIPCAPISRKRRCATTETPAGGCTRTRKSRQTGFGLPPTKRFFDSVNWMDEADREFLACEERSPWRDAYTTVKIARRPRRTIQQRRKSSDVSLCPVSPISLPICIPINVLPHSDHAVPPCTPVQSRQRLTSPPAMRLPAMPSLLFSASNMPPETDVETDVDLSSNFDESCPDTLSQP